MTHDRIPSPPPEPLGWRPRPPPTPAQGRYADPFGAIRFREILRGLGDDTIDVIVATWMQWESPFGRLTQANGDRDPYHPGVMLDVKDRGRFEAFKLGDLATDQWSDGKRVRHIVASGDLADLACWLFSMDRAAALDELERLLAEKRRIGGLGYGAVKSRMH